MSCAPHKFLQTSSQPSRMCREGFLFAPYIVFRRRSFRIANYQRTMENDDRSRKVFTVVLSI
jgi:hypothetical protein